MADNARAKKLADLIQEVVAEKLLRGIKDAPGLVFGLLLVVVMVFMPQGLWGMIRGLGRRFLR